MRPLTTVATKRRADNKKIIQGYELSDYSSQMQIRKKKRSLDFGSNEDIATSGDEVPSRIRHSDLSIKFVPNKMNISQSPSATVLSPIA